MKSVIKKKYGQDACNVGDEGGFAPSIQSNYEGVDLLVEAIHKAGYEKEVKIGMDVAASEFLTKDGKYDLDFKSPTKDGSLIQTGPELAATFIDLCKKYPIVTIEDPFDQDDWENYTAFTAAIGKNVQVVGGENADIFATYLYLHISGQLHFAIYFCPFFESFKQHYML